MSEKRQRKLTVIVVPDGGRDSRTLHIPYRWLRVLAAGGSVVALALTGRGGKLVVPRRSRLTRSGSRTGARGDPW